MWREYCYNFIFNYPIALICTQFNNGRSGHIISIEKSFHLFSQELIVRINGKVVYLLNDASLKANEESDLTQVRLLSVSFIGKIINGLIWVRLLALLIKYTNGLKFAYGSSCLFELDY